MRADVARYLEDVDHTAKVRAVLVEVDGETVLEHYVDADADDFFDSRSVTKSVVAAAVGIAIEEGHIDGVDQTLAELLPDHVGQMSPAVAAVTLEQVLTHTGGFAPDDGPDSEYWDNADPVAAILAAGVGATEDARFTYSSSGSHLLSAVLTEATGETVLDYVGDRLLDPLDVPWEPAFDPVVGHDLDEAEYERYNEQYLASDFGWWRDPAGLHDGGSGMRLRPVDLLALGRLYLHGGRVGDEQVVPATWVETSTQVHVQDTGIPLPRYGYNWWLTDADGHEAFVAFGRGGSDGRGRARPGPRLASPPRHTELPTVRRCGPQRGDVHGRARGPHAPTAPLKPTPLDRPSSETDCHLHVQQSRTSLLR
jgi:CubicO group peptidase (beta-lactamase class C family)